MTMMMKNMSTMEITKTKRFTRSRKKIRIRMTERVPVMKEPAAAVRVKAPAAMWMKDREVRERNPAAVAVKEQGPAAEKKAVVVAVPVKTPVERRPVRRLTEYIHDYENLSCYRWSRFYRLQLYSLQCLKNMGMRSSIINVDKLTYAGSLANLRGVKDARIIGLSG